MYLILQLCTGGELQDWLLRRSEQEPYTEQIAAKVAYDVLQVLACACTPMRARARARARPAFGCVRGLYGAPAPPLPRTLGAARVARQALRKCHELGIVHRDVKPPNLIYSAPPSDEGSLLKLVDFGLAARHSPGDEPLIEARRTRHAPRTPRAH